MTRLVVTGASGFIGRTLMAIAPHARPLSLSSADWRAALAACDLKDAAIVHLGGRAHAQSVDDDGAFADATEKAQALARAAVEAGARAIVFASSIKVNGDETQGQPFGLDDPPRPRGAYARSKLAVEGVLSKAAREHGITVHLVRPPLVYGPTPRGNLASLLRLCDSDWPLPFAAVRNRRSFVAVHDLARLLLACTEHAKAGSHTWMAAHPSAFSTPQLVHVLRTTLGRPPRLFGIPAALLELGGTLGGQGERVRRLTRSLEVDAYATYLALGWHPQVRFEDAVREMATRWIADGRPA